MPMIHRVNTTADANATTRVGSGASVVDTGLARVLRAPASWLVLLVGFSTLLRAGFAARVPTPWILPDELVYSELAKSIASGHRPAVRGVPVFGWGEIYPTLIAPAWALIDDPVRAYHAALDRQRVRDVACRGSGVSSRAALRLETDLVLVAVMTVLVPSMAYTGVVMTENAFYPVFLLAVFLITRDGAAAFCRTSGAGPCFGLGLVAFTRIQGLALVGAYLLAIVIYALTGPREDTGRYLRAIHSHGGLTSRRTPSCRSPPRSYVATVRSAGSARALRRSRGSTRTRYPSGSSTSAPTSSSTLPSFRWRRPPLSLRTG